MYAIYDIKNYEMCVGVFDTRQEVADYLDSTPNSVGSTITRGHIAKKRYLVKRIKEEIC